MASPNSSSEVALAGSSAGDARDAGSAGGAGALGLGLDVEADAQAPVRGRHALRLLVPTRLAPYPRTPWRRWLVRLVFALPFAAAAVWSTRTDQSGSPNAAIVAHVARIDWSAGDLRLVGMLYPPLGHLAVSLLTLVLHGGFLALGLAGAVAAAFFLQEVLQFLSRRRISRGLRAVILIVFLANPITYYLSSEYTTLFVATLLFSMGLIDMVRFVAWDATRAGFRAGVLFMCAALTANVGIAFVLGAVVSAPLLVRGRGSQFARGRGGVRTRITVTAITAVLLFPTVAAFLLWAALELAYHASGPSDLIGDLRTSVPSPASIGTLLTSVAIIPTLLSLLSASAVAVIVRRPGAVITIVVIYAAHAVAVLIGLASTASIGAPFITMLTFSLALIPTARERRLLGPVVIAVVAQIALAWWIALSWAPVSSWMQALVHG